MTIWICDRCKKPENEPSPLLAPMPSILFSVSANFINKDKDLIERLEICLECVKSFIEWKNGSEQK